MDLMLEDTKIENYLKQTAIIDFHNEHLLGFADNLIAGVESDREKIMRIYEFVRDEISHSFDIGAQEVTCKASEVLQAKHGICYAKSHLLVALLRSIGVPAGFCYQGLRFDDDDPRLVLHGLVGVYLKELDQWIRLDARGNKPGVDAQFTPPQEKLAFSVREELGEFESPVIYVEPNKNVVDCLLVSRNVEELNNNLPETI